MKTHRLLIPLAFAFGLLAMLLGVVRSRPALAQIASTANLAIAKQGDAPAVDPGHAASFSITITNTGPLTASLPITISDWVSPAGEIVAWQLPAGCFGILNSGQFTCTLSIPEGSLPLIQSFSYLITTTSTYRGYLTNTAVVTTTVADPDLLNNQATAFILITPTLINHAFLPLISNPAEPPPPLLTYLPLMLNPDPHPLPPPLPPPTPVLATPPIDFAAIRSQLQANGQDLAFVKFGFHTGINGNNTGLIESLTALDAAGVPFTLKNVDYVAGSPLEHAQNLMRASGLSHTLVYRSTGDGYDTPNYDLSPHDAAVAHWNLHKNRFPVELDKTLTWVETINEVDKGRVEWLAEFASETAQLAMADGYKWAAFGWSSGEPEPEHWKGPKMLEFLELAAQHPDRIAIALHEYSYKVDEIGRWYPWLVGRFQFLFDACDRHGIGRPTVIITEWGWEYQDVPDPADAMIDIAWASWLYAAYPEVRGAAIWYLGGGYGGIADQAQQLIAPVRDYALSNYFVIEQGWGQVDPSLFPPPTNRIKTHPAAFNE